MVKEFLNDKVSLYSKISNQSILDKVFVKGVLISNGNTIICSNDNLILLIL